MTTKTNTITARVSTLETGMSALIQGQAAMLDALTAITARLDGDAPAKTAPAKARKATTRKAATPKKAAPKAPAQAKALCKSTRVAFVAAAKAQGLADFAGLSTRVIAAMCVEEPALVPAGFRIGEGYAALLGA